MEKGTCLYTLLPFFQTGTDEKRLGKRKGGEAFSPRSKKAKLMRPQGEGKKWEALVNTPSRKEGKERTMKRWE